MNDIVQEVERVATPGMVIPKPAAGGEFIVKGWGTRRGETVLIYTIPNHKNPGRPYPKGITCSEWRMAFDQLSNTGEFSRKWFDEQLPACAKEGSCNFTTIGGIFEQLGHARHERGVYRKVDRRAPEARA